MDFDVKRSLTVDEARAALVAELEEEVVNFGESEALSEFNWRDNITLCSMDDRRRLAMIEALWAEGKVSLKEVIGVVWRDAPGVSKYNSRAWKRAREEYRRLTGR